MISSVDYGLRLRTLWLCWLLAMLFHVDLGLMPLFHGVSPQIESQVAISQLPLLFRAMLGYFLVPLASLVLIAYAAGGRRRWVRRWQGTHLGLSVLYSLTNGGHMVADILIPDSRPDQVALMAVMVLIGLLINREAWLWWRQGRLRQGKLE